MNQDACGYLLRDGVYCLVTADGLGGYEYGDYASRLGVHTMLEAFSRKPDCSEAAARDYIDYTARHFSQEISRHAHLKTMKTTLSVVLTNGRKTVCAHIGDTRIYILRENEILYQSRDHSLVQSLVDKGEIRQNELRQHPNRNKILSAIGHNGYGASTVLPLTTPLRRGDGILLCSDGFWELAMEQEMLEALANADSTEKWLADMEAKVCNRMTGRSDNYTCLAGIVNQE